MEPAFRAWLSRIGLSDYVDTFDAAGYYSASDILDLPLHDARCIAEEEICIADPGLIDRFLASYASAGEETQHDVPSSSPSSTSSPSSPATTGGHDRRRSELQLALRSGRTVAVEQALASALEGGLPDDDPVVETVREWLDPSPVSHRKEPEFDPVVPESSSPPGGEQPPTFPTAAAANSIWVPLPHMRRPLPPTAPPALRTVRPTSTGKTQPAPASPLAATTTASTGSGSGPAAAGRTSKLAAFMANTGSASETSSSEAEEKPRSTLAAFMEKVDAAAASSAPSTPPSSSCEPSAEQSSSPTSGGGRAGNGAGDDTRPLECHVARMSDYVLFGVFAFAGTFTEILGLSAVATRWRRLMGRLSFIHIADSSDTSSSSSSCSSSSSSSSSCPSYRLKPFGFM